MYNGLEMQGLPQGIPCYGDVIIESEERIISRQFVTFTYRLKLLLIYSQKHYKLP